MGNLVSEESDENYFDRSTLTATNRDKNDKKKKSNPIKSPEPSSSLSPKNLQSPLSSPLIASATNHDTSNNATTDSRLQIASTIPKITSTSPQTTSTNPQIASTSTSHHQDYFSSGGSFKTSATSSTPKSRLQPNTGNTVSESPPITRRGNSTANKNDEYGTVLLTKLTSNNRTPKSRAPQPVQNTTKAIVATSTGSKREVVLQPPAKTESGDRNENRRQEEEQTSQHLNPLLTTIQKQTSTTKKMNIRKQQDENDQQQKVGKKVKKTANTTTTGAIDSDISPNQSGFHIAWNRGIIANLAVATEILDDVVSDEDSSTQRQRSGRKSWSFTTDSLMYATTGNLSSSRRSRTRSCCRSRSLISSPPFSASRSSSPISSRSSSEKALSSSFVVGRLSASTDDMASLGGSLLSTTSSSSLTSSITDRRRHEQRRQEILTAQRNKLREMKETRKIKFDDNALVVKVPHDQMKAMKQRKERREGIDKRKHVRKELRLRGGFLLLRDQTTADLAAQSGGIILTNNKKQLPASVSEDNRTITGPLQKSEKSKFRKDVNFVYVPPATDDRTLSPATNSIPSISSEHCRSATARLSMPATLPVRSTRSTTTASGTARAVVIFQRDASTFNSNLALITPSSTSSSSSSSSTSSFTAPRITTKMYDIGPPENSIHETSDQQKNRIALAAAGIPPDLDDDFTQLDNSREQLAVLKARLNMDHSRRSHRRHHPHHRHSNAASQKRGDRDQEHQSGSQGRNVADKTYHQHGSSMLRTSLRKRIGNQAASLSRRPVAIGGFARGDHHGGRSGEVEIVENLRNLPKSVQKQTPVVNDTILKEDRHQRQQRNPHTRLQQPKQRQEDHKKNEKQRQQQRPDENNSDSLTHCSIPKRSLTHNKILSKNSPSATMFQYQPSSSALSPTATSTTTTTTTTSASSSSSPSTSSSSASSTTNTSTTSTTTTCAFPSASLVHQPPRPRAASLIQQSNIDDNDTCPPKRTTMNLDSQECDHPIPPQIIAIDHPTTTTTDTNNRHKEDSNEEEGGNHPITTYQAPPAFEIASATATASTNPTADATTTTATTTAVRPVDVRPSRGGGRGVFV